MATREINYHGFSTDATYTAANKDNKEQKQQSVYSVDV